MNLFLKSPTRTEVVGNEDHDSMAHSWEVLPLLGLKAGAHLPAEGMEPRIIQGIKVWVAPEPMTRTFKRAAGMRVRKSSTHRVLAECPCCGKTMSVGRLKQHAKVHVQATLPARPDPHNTSDHPLGSLQCDGGAY